MRSAFGQVERRQGSCLQRRQRREHTEGERDVGYQLNARLRRACREGPSLGGSTVGIAGWQSHSATVIAADTRRRSNAERISVRYVRLP